MKIYYITFRSVTFAQRGERILNRNGFRCTLQRTPRWMEEQGCGYALRLWSSEPESAISLLRRHNIPLRRLYLQMPDGQLEEMML